MRNAALLSIIAVLFVVGCRGAEPGAPQPRVSGDPPGINLALAKELLLAEINASRTASGLTRLELDATAGAVAQAHADEMASSGYFSHYDLKGRNPVDRYAAAGGWEPSFENVWRRPGLDSLDADNIRSMHLGFMQSEPHRDNVLAVAHTHVGIGFQYDRSSKSLYGVELFIDRSAHGASLSDYSLGEGEYAEFFLAFDPEKMRFEEIVVAKRDIPSPVGPDWLNENRSYKLPGDYLAIYVEKTAGNVFLPGALSRKTLEYDRWSGLVEGLVRIEPGWTPGLYYFYVWGMLLDSGEKSLVAILVAESS